jgi:hypothetical protein
VLGENNNFKIACLCSHPSYKVISEFEWFLQKHQDFIRASRRVWTKAINLGYTSRHIIPLLWPLQTLGWFPPLKWHSSSICLYAWYFIQVAAPDPSLSVDHSLSHVHVHGHQYYVGQAHYFKSSFHMFSNVCVAQGQGHLMDIWWTSDGPLIYIQ